MRKLLILSVLTLFMNFTSASGQVALLVIDVQDFYFPGGRAELVNPEAAATITAKAISYARDHNYPVIYVQHKASQGMKINDLVTPEEGDRIFVKEDVNSFLGTGLDDYLKTLNTETLVICGMQTHMCVEAAVRAAHDLGYNVILLDDACATRNLTYNGREVSAADVHASTLATMKSYAKVMTVAEWTDLK